MDYPALHKALLRPEAYPEGTGPVTCRETHISHLYFTPRHVYKVKKGVDFGFLNFTTLDRRRFYCEEEIRLNSRFCPGTYLGLVEIRRQGETVAIGGPGELVDYAVRMKRLPDDRMLSRRLQENAPDLPSDIGRIARRLASLHLGSEVCRMDGGQPNLEIVKQNWRENFLQTEPFIGRTLPAQAHALLSGYVADFLEENAAILHEREEQGFVRDGHGDLHVEHICLGEPVCIYDCIEFSRRFRVADVAADLAFLLMDLEFRGRRDLAGLLLDVYLEAAGGDPGMPPLLPFYKIYRAFVRGKVESFLSDDPAAEEELRSRSARAAQRYFNLALGYLCPPALILTCGRMGVGKTTLAGSLARALGARLLRSDVVRKELAGLSPLERCDAPFGGGIYSEDLSRRTYAALLAAALEKTDEASVIVDASFARAGDRRLFQDRARRANRRCFLLHLVCDEETALLRLDRRRAEGADASDGRRDLFVRQGAAFDAVTEENNVIRVDTTDPVDYNVALILCALLAPTGTPS